MAAQSAQDKVIRSWQTRIFWLLWMGYASYYLCRVNFAVAQPAILKEFPGWTGAQIGAIPSIYAMFYAAGQIVNGTLGQKLGTRKMMTMAMIIAALCNFLFSQTSSYEFMLAIWAVNGYAQSAGWSLLIQTLSNWTSSEKRGTLVGLISTCYTVGNVLSWLLAGMLVDSIGWRAAFMVPSFIMIPVVFTFAVGVRNHPEDVGLAHIRDDDGNTQKIDAKTGIATEVDHTNLREILSHTLSNRIVWTLGLGFFCFNSVRYTFMNWVVQYMADFQGRTIKGSAIIAVMFPLIGSLGAISAGWMSDHLFHKRRAPVCAVSLFTLALICAVFVFIPRGEWVLATVMIGVAGFTIYGPDMLMSGAATIDFSHPRAASIATGFTMCLGALGAIFSGAGVGYLKDIAQGSWNLIFWVLSALSIISGLLMVTIWNAKPKGAQ